MEFAPFAYGVLAGRPLDAESAQTLMRAMITGELTEGQIGAALALLAAKGVSGAELAAFAAEVRAHATQVQSSHPDLVDTCGTGGGASSFNISTAAALIAAAAGVTIAKHCNRAVTSACGSADVLEHLGVPVGSEPEQLLHMLDTVGIAFMFAPSHHPALKHVGKVRRELGFRTIFNMIGPLANPAGAKRQLVGVFDPGILRPMAEALAALGTERAFIVHGNDGLDEISPITSTSVCEVSDGNVIDRSLSPEDFELTPVSPSAIAPDDSIAGNAAILIEAISDPDSARCRAVMPSAAAAIFLGGRAPDLKSAAAKAHESVANGSAKRKLEALAEASQAA